MAKKKTSKPSAKLPETKSNSGAASLARGAGKAAAKAERAALDAVERARDGYSMLLDLFSHPGQVVESIGSEMGKLLGSGGEAPKSEPSREDVARAFESRLRSVVEELGLPSREELEAITSRLAAIEGGAKRPSTRAKAGAPRAGARKTATPKAGTKAGAVKVPAKRAATKSPAKPAAKRAERTKSENS